MADVPLQTVRFWGSVCALFVCLFVSAGCERRDQISELCDKLIKQQIRSPSTYRPVETSRYQGESGHQVAFIEFDAANAYGTPVRSNARCAIDSHGTIMAFSVGQREIKGAELELINIGLQAEAVRREAEGLAR